MESWAAAMLLSLVPDTARLIIPGWTVTVSTPISQADCISDIISIMVASLIRGFVAATLVSAMAEWMENVIP